MIRKPLITIAAIVVVFATAPGIADYIAADKASNADFVVPDGSVKTRAPFAGLFVFDGGFKKVSYKVNRKRKIGLTQNWPSCDAACQHFRKASDTNVQEVVSLTVGKAQLASSSVNRAHKSDRLPRTSIAEQKQKFGPSSQIAPASLKRIPEGCDPAFSPVADPDRALIRMRCIT